MTNVAVMLVAPEMVVVQVPVPPQPPPLQPVKTLFASGVAVRVTLLPEANRALQVAPQVIPAGLEVTVPVPVPALVTVSKYVGMNVAVTLVEPVIVTVQVPVPLQPPPLHPVNAMFASGVAVRVTLVP